MNTDDKIQTGTRLLLPNRASVWLHWYFNWIEQSIQNGHIVRVFFESLFTTYWSRDKLNGHICSWQLPPLSRQQIYGVLYNNSHISWNMNSVMFRFNDKSEYQGTRKRCHHTVPERTEFKGLLCGTASRRFKFTRPRKTTLYKGHAYANKMKMSSYDHCQEDRYGILTDAMLLTGCHKLWYFSSQFILLL